MSVESAVNGARCWSCVPPRTQFEIQTYILAVIAGQNPIPAPLAEIAKCLSCLSSQTLYELKAYLLADLAGLSTDPQEMVSRAKCYICEVPEGLFLDVQTYALSLDPSGPGETNPSTLQNLAKDFQGLNPVDLLQIQVYLLATLAGVSVDPTALAALVKCYRCLPQNMVMAATAQALDQAEIDGGGGINPGGGCTIGTAPVISNEVYTDGIITSVDVTGCACADAFDWVIYGSNNPDGSGAIELTTWADTGTQGQSVTETIPIPVPVSFGYYYITMRCGTDESPRSSIIYADLTCGDATNYIEVLYAGSADANGVYTWDQAEFNSSGRFTYVNAVTNWMIEFTNGGGGVLAYIYDDLLNIAYHMDLAYCFPCGSWSRSGADTGTDPPPNANWTTQGVERAYDWAARVVTNGGAAPAAATIAAVGVFNDAMYVAGIYSKFKALNLFVPDSLIAAITPQIKGVGGDPWTNVNFVAGDLTINGLKGDGTKYLDTGVNPATAYISDNNGGISMYTLGPAGGFAVECGARNATGGACIFLYAQFANNTYFQCFSNSGAGSIDYANATFTGFISGNRVSGVDIKLYDANSGSAFAQRATGGGNLGGRPNVGTMVAFGSNDNGTKTAYSSKRLSFLAMHDGLTSTQAEDLYDAVQAFRITIGGGFV